MMPAMRWGAIEGGGTHFRCAVFEGRETALPEVVRLERFGTSTPGQTLGRCEGFFAGEQLRGLGIAMFGPLDREAGNIGATPKPGWSSVPLRSRFEAALGVPVVVDTDVNAAAIAEQRWGELRGTRLGAYVTVGTGIGVGLALDGGALPGTAHAELGHAMVRRAGGDAFAGSCPFHGDCLEGLASGAALNRRAELLGLSGVGALPEQVWSDVGNYLGQALALIRLGSAPQGIAVGGGVVAGRPTLLARARESAEEVLAGYVGMPRVGLAALEDSGLFGAAALVMGDG